MQQMFMYMSNMLEAVDIDVMKNGFMQMFSGGISAALQSFIYGLLTLVCKVLGIFADLMNVAFYIFAGIDISGADGTSMYAIEVAGEKQNILDYFVLSETMRNAYAWLSIAAVVLIVIFTIYKIVKQDYFDKSGPRSKGPIFRNVAISCISFLLVIPIFLVIIHASSLLAVLVMDMLGLDVNVLAGAKVFLLSWSDDGEMVSAINSLYTEGNMTTPFTTMNNLDGRTLFTLLANRKSLSYASNLYTSNGDKILSDAALANGDWIKSNVSLSEFGMITASGPMTGSFYWYIYLVGVIITIKSLYKMLLAMLQRIFKLMGLFLVAPSPISQYVLDDGQKFKSWLQQSIQEGLRLVSATMSFSIFLMALSLIGDISFTNALKSSMTGTGAATNVVLLADGGGWSNTSDAAQSFIESTASGFVSDNVLLNLMTGSGALNALENLQEVKIAIVADVAGFAAKYTGLTAAKDWVTDGLWALGDAFIKIFMLIGAGGAIIDLDGVITPLISGAKNSLDAGQTGSSANSLVSGAATVGAKMAGAAFGKVTQAIKNRNAASEGKEEGRAKADKEQAEAEKGANGPQPGNGGPGSGGPGAGGDGDKENGGKGNNAEAPQAVNSENKGEDKQGDENGTKSPDSNNSDNNNSEDNKENGSDSENKENENKNNSQGTAQVDAPKPTNRLVNKLGQVAKGAAKVVKGGAKGIAKASGAIGLTAALKAGLKSAGGAIATGVFGKDVAKAFGEARGDAVKAENAAAAKRKDEAREQGYAERRQEQLQEAQQVVQNKSGEVNDAANELNAASAAEKPAAEQLEQAQTQAAADKVAAADASSKVEQKAGADEIRSYMAKSQGKKDAAESQNKDIEKEHGNEQQINNKIELARASGDKKEERKYSAILDKYRENKQTISQADEQIKAGQSKLDAIDIATGKNGKLNSMLGDKANGKYADVIKTIDKKLKDSSVSSEDKAALSAIKDQLQTDVGAEKFDSKEAKKARNANATSAQSQQTVGEAQANYNKKHDATVKARNNLQGKLNELNNAVSMTDKLEDDINSKGGNSFTNKRSGSVGKEGHEAAQNNRRRSKYNAVNSAREIAETTQKNSNVSLDNLSKDNIIERLDSLQATNNSEIETARQERDTKVSQAGDKLKQHFESQKIPASEMNFINEKNGKVNEDKLKQFKQEHGIKDDDTKFNDSIKEYTTSVNSADASYKQVKKAADSRNARISTARNAIGAATSSASVEHTPIERQSQKNSERMQVLSNDINTINDVISGNSKGTGRGAPLTESTRNMINSAAGTNLTAESSRDEVVKAAKQAKAAKSSELEGLGKSTDNLSAQSKAIGDTLSAAVVSALKSVGINVNVDSSNNGNGANQSGNAGANGANKPGNGVQGPNNVQNITNVNNNNNNVLDSENGNDNELPASSGLAQSKDLNSYYERMQVESIKHVQTVLDDIKHRDEEIQNNVEHIKHKVDEDNNN